jgi:hypothetical protein
MRLRGHAAALALAACACTSVEYARLPKAVGAPTAAGQPIAAIQVSRMGLYVLGVAIADCDLDLLFALLAEAGQKVGADRLVDVHFDITPSAGLWWFFTRVLPFPPTARAWAIAVRAAPAPPDGGVGPLGADGGGSGPEREVREGVDLAADASVKPPGSP